VERYVLDQAQRAGILTYTETCDGGAHQFACRPQVEGLAIMLAACLYPELLLTDAQTDTLLDRYLNLCTPVERELFREFIGRLPDRRLALLIRPQREFGSLLPLGQAGHSPSVDPSDRADFAIEVPCYTDDSWLRVALEADDAGHRGAQGWTDQERDRLLRAGGWDVLRFKVDSNSRRRWAGRLAELASRLQDAIPATLLSAARQLRDLPPSAQAALQALVHVPIAEAQTTAALGYTLYWGSSSVWWWQIHRVSG
jgi:hypothetical protein